MHCQWQKTTTMYHCMRNAMAYGWGLFPLPIEVGLGLCWGMLIIPGCIKERTAKGFVCGDVRCTLGMHAYFELLRNSPHCVSNNTHEVLRNAVLLSIPVTGLIDILSAREIQHD